MQNFDSVDDFYAALGYGAVNVHKIANRIKQAYLNFRKIDFKANFNLTNPIKISSRISRVFVEGIGRCTVVLSKCCNPILGCTVVGYITKNKKISVHCLSCANVRRIQNNVNRQNRFINVQFDESLNTTYCSSLKIVVQNTIGVIGAINSKLRNFKVEVKKFNADFTSDGFIQMKISILIFCVNQLKNVVSALKKVRGVSSVNISTKF